MTARWWSSENGKALGQLPHSRLETRKTEPGALERSREEETHKWNPKALLLLPEKMSKVTRQLLESYDIEDVRSR